MFVILFVSKLASRELQSYRRAALNVYHVAFVLVSRVTNAVAACKQQL